MTTNYFCFTTGGLMKSYTVFTALATLLLISCSAEAAKDKPINGTISKVQQDSGKETGSITVKVVAKVKKGDTAAPTATPEEKTFTISESTKIETVSGKKKDATTSPAKFSELTAGKDVIITSSKNSVESVKITKAKKKKTDA